MSEDPNLLRSGLDLSAIHLAEFGNPAAVLVATELPERRNGVANGIVPETEEALAEGGYDTRRRDISVYRGLEEREQPHIGAFFAQVLKVDPLLHFAQTIDARLKP